MPSVGWDLQSCSLLQEVFPYAGQVGRNEKVYLTDEARWRSAPGWRIIDIDSVPISSLHTVNRPKSTDQDYVEGRHR